jgi:phosphoenolpyruvate synthase/pyruvate phosphate dikinase
MTILLSYFTTALNSPSPSFLSFHQIGVCGEHGGDPASIRFFDELGLDYVSCSPFRVPTAKIAAAQAHIEAVNSE